MNNGSLAIVSKVSQESIDRVREDRESILATCFNPEEKQELGDRHVRSTAGNLALKRAIAALFEERWGVLLKEKDIQITRSENGAPLLDLRRSRIRPVPDFDRRCLFLSLSHSRTMAYGLAVYQEPNHE